MRPKKKGAKPEDVAWSVAQGYGPLPDFELMVADNGFALRFPTFVAGGKTRNVKVASSAAVLAITIEVPGEPFALKWRGCSSTQPELERLRSGDGSAPPPSFRVIGGSRKRPRSESGAFEAVRMYFFPPEGKLLAVADPYTPKAGKYGRLSDDDAHLEVVEVKCVYDKTTATAASSVSASVMDATQSPPAQRGTPNSHYPSTI